MECYHHLFNRQENKDQREILYVSSHGHLETKQEPEPTFVDFLVRDSF